MILLFRLLGYQLMVSLNRGNLLVTKEINICKDLDLYYNSFESYTIFWVSHHLYYPYSVRIGQISLGLTLNTTKKHLNFSKDYARIL